jgi:hypothetical protein
MVRLTALVVAALLASTPLTAQGRDSTRRDSTMRDSSMRAHHDSAMHHDSSAMHHDSPAMHHDSSATHHVKTGLPPGTYRTTITRANIPASMSRSLADSLIGVWEIRLHSDDRYTVRYKGEEVVAGMLTGMPEHRVAFDDQDTGSAACHAPATYHFVLGTRRITFHQVGTDACDGRAVVLTAHPWMRR